MQNNEGQALWFAIHHGRVDRRHKWMEIRLNDEEVANLEKVLITVVGPFRRQKDVRNFIREEKASDRQRAELINQLRLQWPKQPSQMTSVIRRLTVLQKESEKRRIRWRDETTGISFVEPHLWWCETLEDAALATTKPYFKRGTPPAISEPVVAHKLDDGPDDCE